MYSSEDSPEFPDAKKKQQQQQQQQQNPSKK